MLLNFREIPKANEGSGLQDTFELFARDFLEDFGYKVIQNPDRGADGRKDIIVEETRQGVGGVTIKKWIVSCKHFAHSGSSVNQDDEPDILDRVKTHKCDGFIGFYSTLPAVSLSNKLLGLFDKIEYQVFDREKIEKRLLESVSGNKLAQRYFPQSYKNYSKENPSPVNLFSDQTSIHCENCGKDLLKSKEGIFVALEARPKDYNKPDHTMGIYFSCKGRCDHILRSKYRNQGLHDAGWDDLPDLLIPTPWLFKFNTIINTLMNGETYEKEAIEKIKLMFICCFPYISRELTTKEKERVDGLMSIPGFLGGMNSE
jgi:hypothetical protein